MWTKPWRIKEGFSLIVGLFIIGAALQAIVGSINWSSLAAPLNFILLAIYVAALVVLYLLKEKIYFIRWAMTYQAAIPSLISVLCITLVMGLVKQVPEGLPPTDVAGLSKMVSFWSFVLLYFWMITIVGLVSIKMIAHFSWRKLPHILNHLGLFIAMVAATLGAADMQRVTLNAKVGSVEWRASTQGGEMVELPIAIELHEFSIEEYPPKLLVIDNKSGEALPKGGAEHILLEEGVTQGSLLGKRVQILNQIENAAPVVGENEVRYVEWLSIGATNAVEVSVSFGDTTVVGWVSSGSFMFPHNALKLDDECSLVLPEREPKKYSSRVDIYSQDGERFSGEIEVNKPAYLSGWKIYQLSYDETKGKWSDISVFELVRDPWLPAVYVGIIMLMIGAVLIFVTSQSKRGVNDDLG